MRHLFTILALALVSAACGSGDGTTDPASTSIPGTRLAYQYSTGDHLVYDFEMTQGIVATIDFEATPGLLGDSDVPGETDIAVTVTGVLIYDITDGPDPGTYEISITGEFTDTTVSGTIDRRPVSEMGDLPTDLAPALTPPELTIVIDESGRLVSTATSAGDVFGLLADPTAVAAMVGLDPLTGHLGPVFPTEPIATGETWTDDVSREVLGTPTTTTSTHTFTDIAQSGAGTFAMIDSTLSSSGFEVSLGQLLAALFGGSNDLADGASTGDVSSQVAGAGFDMLIAGEAMTGRSSSSFDLEAGRLHRYELTTTSPIAITLTFPNEETGEPTDGEMLLTTVLEFAAELRLDASS
jgi:hypothetical protein